MFTCVVIVCCVRVMVRLRLKGPDRKLKVLLWKVVEASVMLAQVSTMTIGNVGVRWRSWCNSLRLLTFGTCMLANIMLG